MNTGPQETLFGFLLIFVIMGIGGEVIAKSMGPRAQKAYHAFLKKAFKKISGYIRQFVRWAWREHKKFIIGAIAGAAIIIYILSATGHLQ